MVALCREARLQAAYLADARVETIYLGGGTPSLASQQELERLFDALYKHFRIAADAEISLEANPDDLTAEKVRMLRQLPVNRISIGVQSFRDRTLQLLNRTHTAAQAEASVKRVQDAGWDNVSIDLLYGLPELSEADWRKTVEQALLLQVPHLSCYALTVEPNTLLARWQAKGIWKPADEDIVARQLELLMAMMREAGWLHYEISNFARQEEFVSRHNSGYWQGKAYLGLGPSAHSFNGVSRQWNVSNIYKYLEALEQGHIPCEAEVLTPQQRINERLLTELRTMWGFSLEALPENDRELMYQRSQPFLEGGWLRRDEHTLYLTDSGKLIADKIILELMLEEP